MSSEPLHPDEFLTKAQLLKWLGLSNPQRLAAHDLGLPFIKVGSETFYHAPAVCRWLKAREQTRTA